MAKRNSVESSSQLEFKKNYGTAFDDEVKYSTSHFEKAIEVKTNKAFLYSNSILCVGWEGIKMLSFYVKIAISSYFCIFLQKTF